ncbi:MAG: hypothetical protein ACX94D_08300 [Henriciella sp.]
MKILIYSTIALASFSSALDVHAQVSREEFKGTRWETLSDSEYGARLAWQQVQCFRWALSAHEGTASQKQRENLYLGGVENLKQFVRDARAGNFPERPNVPTGMTLGGHWKYDTVDFAAGALYESISEYSSEPIYERSFNEHLKDDSIDNYGDLVPSDEWADRATLLFVREKCPQVAEGKLVCDESAGCM